MDVRMGFTGTQEGMSETQKVALRMLISKVQPKEFHHGDCVGADEEAHQIVREESPFTRIFIHPPTDQKKRAFCKGDVTFPALPYLDRNHRIVDVSTVLVAAPKGSEVLRSGTWATVRYARRYSKAITMLHR